MLSGEEEREDRRVDTSEEEDGVGVEERGAVKSDAHKTPLATTADRGKAASSAGGEQTRCWDL